MNIVATHFHIAKLRHRGADLPEIAHFFTQNFSEKSESYSYVLNLYSKAQSQKVCTILDLIVTNNEHGEVVQEVDSAACQTKN